MNIPDTIDMFLDEVLDKYVANYNLEQLGHRQSGQQTIKQAIKQFIKNRVKEAKGEVVKKCNATGKKSMCPNCNYPALFERAVGGTECIVCEYQMPF